MSEDVIEELAHDRDEWLTKMGYKEGDVLEDREGAGEFVFASPEDNMRIFLPHWLQKTNIYR